MNALPHWINIVDTCYIVDMYGAAYFIFVKLSYNKMTDNIILRYDVLCVNNTRCTRPKTLEVWRDYVAQGAVMLMSGIQTGRESS